MEESLVKIDVRKVNKGWSKSNYESGRDTWHLECFKLIFFLPMVNVTSPPSPKAYPRG